MKVIGSTTGMTCKEQKFYKDRREVERQNRSHEKVLTCQDGIEAHKEVLPVIFSFFVPGIPLFQNLWQK
ncbi:MAG TPA: hypothetical protein VER35_03535 [Candidatus Limnocylindrales bacterium]|nr:hypothetical protein [Candidatus Limnocylindrales bacterium]